VPTTLYASSPDEDLLKSTDGGATWAAIGAGLQPPGLLSLKGLAIDPSNTSTLYAANGFGVSGTSKRQVAAVVEAALDRARRRVGPVAQDACVGDGALTYLISTLYAKIITLDADGWRNRTRAELFLSGSGKPSA